MSATHGYGLVSMKRTLSYANGWTGEMVYCLPQSEVDAHIAANYLMAYPGVPQLTVSQISDDPWMADDVVQPGGMSVSRRLVYAFALNYLNVNWPTSITKPTHRNGTTLRLEAKFSGQFLTIPARGLQTPSSSGYVSGGQPVVPRNINNRVLIPLIDFQIEWDRVQGLDTSGSSSSGIEAAYTLDFTQYIGHVNSETFLGCEPETLLLEGVNITPSFVINPTNPHAYKAVATFKRRKIVVGNSSSGDGSTVYGWNHDYLPIPPGWQRVLMADGSWRYPTVDFTNIFM